VLISETLIERGFQVYGVDASATKVAAFRGRFPSVPVECSSVEVATFLDRRYDGVVSWGLFFLLDADAQRKLIARIAKALVVGGQLLFTSPWQASS
jgi:cyclopropane fatty-acyl-phospholipid synthase-like methyltransferase